MRTVDRPAAPAGVVVEVGLGAVFALGLALTAYLLIDSWGGGYWAFNCAVGGVVGALALCRRRQVAHMAVAGLAVAALAVAVALATDLPQEPGPVTALALAVLTGASVRTLPVPVAGVIATGGLAVVVGAWVSGSAAASVLATLGWVGAVGTGLGLRAGDRGRRPYS